MCVTFNKISDTKLKYKYLLLEQGRAERRRNARMLTYILLWKQNHVLVMYLYPNLMETGQIAFFQKAKEIFSEDCGCKETSKNVEKVCAFKQ
jgi:hypothetical protein